MKSSIFIKSNTINRFLHRSLPPELRDKVHFFNTYFFEKLSAGSLSDRVKWLFSGPNSCNSLKKNWSLFRSTSRSASIGVSWWSSNL